MPLKDYRKDKYEGILKEPEIANIVKEFDTLYNALEKAGEKYAQASEITHKRDGTTEIWFYGTGNKEVINRVVRELYGPKAKSMFMGKR